MASLTSGKIRIRLKAYDHDAIDRAAQEIVGTAERTGATVSGPVPLPTEKNVYCVIRSPFKDKDSREHFEIRTHKRLIDIHQPTPKTVDELQRMETLPGRRRRGDPAVSAIVGKKLGMTRVFDEDGTAVPVTVIEAAPNTITAIRRADRDGYDAVQLAGDPTDERKLTKAELGHLKKAGAGPSRTVVEFRDAEFPAAGRRRRGRRGQRPRTQGPAMAPSARSGTPSRSPTSRPATR